MKTQVTYTVRPMADDDCRSHGVERADYSNGSLLLAEFSDGQAFWFVDNLDGTFCGVAVYDDVFNSERDCLAYIRREMLGSVAEVVRAS